MLTVVICISILVSIIADSDGKQTYEPRHDKTNIKHLQPVWIQTSLIRIHAVCLPSILQVDNLIANSMNPDQTALILL
jgi:hypothetical protein